MQIQFIKNIQFTKLVKVEGRLKEFNFRKVNVQGEELFTVDVSDERGNRIMFRMHKEGNSWKIIPQPLPEWVLTKEQAFDELIEAELHAA